MHLHLGFLTAGGVYVTDVLPPRAAAAPAPLVHGLEASNLSVSADRREGGTQVLTLRLLADAEGPFSTAFYLDFPGRPEPVAVHVTATVMSRRKGTPGLKDSVRCAGFTPETDTEAASDAC